MIAGQREKVPAVQVQGERWKRARQALRRRDSGAGLRSSQRVAVSAAASYTTRPPTIVITDLIR
jgi:hypothetical protein